MDPSRVPGAIAFNPDAVPEDVAWPLWRAMTRRGHDVDFEDAQLFAAMVIAAVGEPAAERSLVTS
jgi:hypothetical protein